MSAPPAASRSRRSSRQKRRSASRLSPRDLAYQELAAGTITQATLERKRSRIFGRECSSTWGEDVWEGKDRDYAAEGELRRAGRKDPRVYTGSGTLKKTCAKCHHDVPPQHCPGKVCEECRFEGGGEHFITSVPGSSHRKLIGEEA